MKQQELEKQIEILKLQKHKSYNKGFWTGLLLGMIAMLFIIAIASCDPPRCYSCTIKTNWSEIGKSYDTTIFVCDPLGGIENFEKNNTYVDTVLSNFDTYQTCSCK